MRRGAISLIFSLALLIGSTASADVEQLQAEINAEVANPEGAGEHHEPLTLGHVFKNYEFLGALVNFIVLVLILRMGVKKVGNPALSARSELIASELKEAQRLKAEAEAVHAEFKAKLDKLDSEIESLRADMVKAGEAERDRIVAEAETKAARMRREQAFLIEQEMKQLKKDVLGETVQAAIAHAEQLISQSASSADHDRLASDYLGAIKGEMDAPKGKRL
ncbi:MAG: ATP synthase F0 subunit B [Polyangiales bacterium]